MAGCSKKQEAPHAQQAPQVVVFTVNPAALPMSAELPGRTNAYQVADVRPQVGGLIQKRLFVEGSDVKAGTALYQIDPATYQAAYNSAKAALSKAKANLLTAGPKASRYKELVAIEGVSRQEYDDAVAAFEQAKADVESAAAALENGEYQPEVQHRDGTDQRPHQPLDRDGRRAGHGGPGGSLDHRAATRPDLCRRDPVEH